VLVENPATVKLTLFWPLDGELALASHWVVMEAIDQWIQSHLVLAVIFVFGRGGSSSNNHYDDGYDDQDDQDDQDDDDHDGGGDNDD